MGRNKAIKPRPFIALDLEMNMDRPRGTLPIIQIGAVAGLLDTGEVISEFSLIVNPQETLLPEIVELTGITQSQVNSAPRYSEALQEFNAWCQRLNAHHDAIVWGGGDTALMYEEHAALNRLTPAPYIQKRIYMDVRSLYKAYAVRHSLKRRKNLVDALAICGLQFEGRPHDALNDARATFKLASYLVNEIKPRKV